ncbi:ABC transporter ATP-binding protein/permease [Thalassospira povalilytica]|nr:ABC transporter ATP-binding protein/permease [Thalassospira povalilytica]
MHRFRKNNFINSWRLGIGLMTARERKMMFSLFFFVLAVGSIEMIAVYSVAPFFKFILSGGDMGGVPEVLDNFLKNKSETTLIWIYAGVPAFLLLFSFLSSVAMSWVVLRFGIGRWQRISRDIVSLVQNVDSGWHSKVNASEVVRTFFQDTQYFARDFVIFTLTSLADIVVIIVLMFLLFFTLPWQGIVFFILIGAAIVFVVAISRPRLTAYSEVGREMANEMNVKYGELLRGYKDIRYSLKPQWFDRSIDSTVLTASQTHMKLNLWGKVPPQFINFLSQFSLLTIVLIMYGAGMPLAEIAASIAILGIVASRALPVANRLAVNLGKYWQVHPFLLGLTELQEELLSCQIESNGSNAPSCRDMAWNSVALKLDNFSIAGANRASLRNIDIKLEKGGLFGLVGPSGGGKTSLIDVLMALSNTSPSAVSLDGIQLSELDISSYRGCISYVPQTPFLIDGSILQNIALGVPEADVDMDLVRECIEKSGLVEVVDSLPEGIHASVGDFGGRFSGGQRQRVAIARALYKKPKMLLLDEATSALDGKMEDAMRVLFEDLSRDLIVFLVSHRYKVLENAKEIFVLDHGEVIEQGSYRDLISANGAFWRMISLGDEESQLPQEEVNEKDI